ncbi:MAG: hypothetical protein JWM25_1141 [Thermoleophilia bacterium]|nr:hypothetical protein [Thermoleophilia bacterium]MCZ4496558.1 hypothetical protein [Thermoleophilia bacterium]
MRLTSTLRSALATALVSGALLLPAGAFAAPNFSVGLTSAGPYVAGDTATYTLTVTNAGDALPPFTEGDLELSWNGSPVTVVGTPVKAGANAAALTVAAGSNSVHVEDTFGAGAATVAFAVQLPTFYTTSFDVDVTGTGGDLAAEFASDTSRTVSKGGATNVDFSFSGLTPTPGLLDKWVTKGGSFTATVTVKNNGGSAANYMVVDTDAFGNESLLSPTFAPNPAFDPVVTVVANGSCAPIAGGECRIDALASGASVTFPVQVTALTHFGRVWLSAGVNQSANTSISDDYDGSSIAVTDGTTAAPIVSFADAPTMSAGNADVVFNAEAINLGPDKITNGLLNVSAKSFTAAGDEWFFGPGQLQSISKVTISTGAACANQMNGATPVLDSWVCPVAELAVGSRITFQVTAKFPTAKADQNGWVSGEIVAASYEGDGSTGGSHSVRLNPTKTQDLEVMASSAAVIGADRIGAQTITVTNKGATKSENVSVHGSLRGVAGTFDVATMPGNCTGVTKPQFTVCYLGAIEPGAKKTIVLPVRGGTKLGALAATYWVMGTEFDANPDNNEITHVVDVVKAASVPLGAKIGKGAALKGKTFAAKGMVTKVTCPSTCTVKVQLWAKRSIAMKLKLKLPKRGDVLIGTATKKSNAKGATTVVTKVAKAHKAKIAAYKSAFVVTRKTTAVSTAAATKGATTLSTQNVTIKK